MILWESEPNLWLNLDRLRSVKYIPVLTPDPNPMRPFLQLPPILTHSLLLDFGEPTPLIVTNQARVRKLAEILGIGDLDSKAQTGSGPGAGPPP